MLARCFLFCLFLLASFCVRGWSADPHSLGPRELLGLCEATLGEFQAFGEIFDEDAFHQICGALNVQIAALNRQINVKALERPKVDPAASEALALREKAQKAREEELNELRGKERRVLNRVATHLRRFFRLPPSPNQAQRRSRIKELEADIEGALEEISGLKAQLEQQRGAITQHDEAEKELRNSLAALQGIRRKLSLWGAFDKERPIPDEIWSAINITPDNTSGWQRVPGHLIKGITQIKGEITIGDQVVTFIFENDSNDDVSIDTDYSERVIAYSIHVNSKALSAENEALRLLGDDFPFSGRNHSSAYGAGNEANEGLEKALRRILEVGGKVYLTPSP